MGASSATQPARKGERTRLAMLQAAIDILDESGPDALTLQTLGERLGLHRTAVYRHFANRDALLAEAMEHLIAEVADGITLPADPRGRILTIALAMRRMFHRFPGASMILVTTGGVRPASSQMEGVVLQSLRELGVPDADLPVVYQAMESFTIGGPLFDFFGAPLHLETRRERHAAVGDPGLNRITSSSARIDANNEAAFLWGLEALLDQVEAKVTPVD
jgi:AcrR family transcriptional regulator